MNIKNFRENIWNIAKVIFSYSLLLIFLLFIFYKTSTEDPKKIACQTFIYSQFEECMIEFESNPRKSVDFFLIESTPKIELLIESGAKLSMLPLTADDKKKLRHFCESRPLIFIKKWPEKCQW